MDQPLNRIDGSAGARRHFRYFDYVMVGFVAILLLSNLIGAAKLSTVAGFTFGAGILFFPVSYVIGDVLTEVYGYANARRCVWAGFFAMLFMAFMSFVVVGMPASPEWGCAASGDAAFADVVTASNPGTVCQATYESVFGSTWRIVAASVMAFWAGEFVNSFVLAKMKILTQGKHLWSRTIGSTVFGQAVDSAIFYPVAFLGVWPTSAVLTVMVTNWALKVAWEAVLTPVTYGVVGWLKGREGVDVYDTGTEFSPFAKAEFGLTSVQAPAMVLDRILLSDFRNHRQTAIEGTAGFNLLVGENGAGKTNVLEAISLFAPGRGLRRAALADMPGQSGAGGFAVSAELATPAGPVRLGTGVSPERPGRRIVQVNQADAPAIRLAEWLSIGWLTPAMDRLFAEGAGARRRFLDRLVLAREPGHAKNTARAENALRERNRLLGEVAEPDSAWLDAIEAQLAEAGALVAGSRARLVGQLGAALAELPDAPFARPSLAYVPGGPVDQTQLAAALADGRRRDRAAQRTLTGPHRDELAVTLAGKGQKASECSTGEQKAMLIAITLAHAGLLGAANDAEGRPRLLLLDEVAAHLDPLRREALFDRLRAGGAQLWLTGTELAPFAAIESEAAIWRVSEGAVKRIS